MLLPSYWTCPLSGLLSRSKKTNIRQAQKKQQTNKNKVGWKPSSNTNSTESVIIVGSTGGING
jgi:hypothetical protein